MTLATTIPALFVVKYRDEKTDARELERWIR